jgi:signal transduction histidine kinase
MTTNNKEIIKILSKPNISNLKYKNINQENIMNNFSKYYDLLQKYNIKQLSFSLPNNESFLFFNQHTTSLEYTANLKEISNQININKKPINGFLKNDFLKDYLFGYPLFSPENRYLGNIVILFNTTAFNNDFATTYEKKSTNFINFSNILNSPYDKKVLSKITNKDFNNTFSIYDSKSHYITTFIPIKTLLSQQLIGVFTIEYHTIYIYNKIKSFYQSLLLTYLIMTILFIYIYKTKIIYNNTTNRLSEEIKIQDNILLKQAKLAQLGEIIDSIAHQWKTPISIIKLYLEHSILLLQDKKNEIDKVLQFQDKSILQLNHLVNTVNEFKAFLRPISKIENIPIKAVIDSTLLLMKDELIRHTINIDIKGDTTSVFSIIPNEFKHILINLFNNSKDAFKERNIAGNKLIILKIINGPEYNQLEIYDNAGGIPQDILNHIFEANFTTKHEENGSGIGLYLVKKIVEKLDGTIKAHNTKEGVCFTIKIKTIDYI